MWSVGCGSLRHSQLDICPSVEHGGVGRGLAPDAMVEILTVDGPLPDPEPDRTAVEIAALQRRCRALERANKAIGEALGELLERFPS